MAPRSTFEIPELGEPSSTNNARAEVFLKAIEGAAMKVTQSALTAFGDSMKFRELALALLVRTMLCKQGQQGRPNPSISSRLSLITSFVQGVDVTKKLVLGGYHSKAAAALKQDYEILTRIREVTAGKSKDGVTPNVKHAPVGSQRLYGALNDVAHPSNEALINRHLLQHDANGVPGVSPFPTFVKRTIEVHWWTHVWLVFELCREAVRLLIDNYGEDDPSVRDCLERFPEVEDEGVRCKILKVVRGEPQA